MQTGKERAMEELRSHYARTKFNSYPKIKLRHKTEVTDKELHALLKEGLIGRRRGLNDTNIVLEGV